MKENTNGFLDQMTRIAESLLSLEGTGGGETNSATKGSSLKSISATLINFAYLVTKLVDSIETLSIHLSKSKMQQYLEEQQQLKKENKKKKGKSTRAILVGKVEEVTYQVLDILTFLLPLVRVALPGTQLTLLLIVLAYRMNLFRKVLAVAKNESVYHMFQSTVVPVLKLFHIPTGRFIQSKL